MNASIVRELSAVLCIRSLMMGRTRMTRRKVTKTRRMSRSPETSDLPRRAPPPAKSKGQRRMMRRLTRAYALPYVTSRRTMTTTMMKTTVMTRTPSSSWRRNTRTFRPPISYHARSEERPCPPALPGLRPNPLRAKH